MKDAYYFSHDSNAHQDPKITKMLLTLKAEGYGVYWVIVEMLRNEPALKLNKNDYDAIAYQSHCQRNTVERVVEEFQLFTIDENGDFYSESLMRRVEMYKEKSRKYAENANKRWNKNAMAVQSQCNGNALKESKVKESKYIAPEDIEKTLEAKIGRIATKDMIKAVLREFPEKLWWTVDKFLKKRYPEGGNGFELAQRELMSEKHAII